MEGQAGTEISDQGLLALFGAIVAAALLAGVGARSTSVWALEVVPVAIVLPLLWWTRHWMRFTRLVDALIAVREILIRRTELTSRRLITVLALFATLGASAMYEIVEMVLALTGGAGARVDSQGDIWDPVWDMFFCLCGALSSLLLLGRAHDRAIAAVEPSPAVVGAA